MLESYRELIVWQRAMDIAESCYHLTRGYPREEAYGMTAQIRRAASAIPANIAEGYGRGHRSEYIQFLRIAQGSLKELETHLILGNRVGFSSNEDTDRLLSACTEVGKMLTSLIRSLLPKEH